MILSLSLLLLVAALPGRAADIRITILHTNDIHGWIMPRPATSYAPDPRRLVGGAAALAAYVRQVPGPKLLLDAGDWFLGTPEGGLRQGRAMAEVFNAVGYDALAVGNHDFDNGEANLEAMIRDLSAPVLCANIYRADGQHAPECKPWIIKEVAGVKIGIFGLLLSRMKGRAFAENIAGLAFRRGVDEARDAVAALREQGATVIIALSHQGLESPQEPDLEGDRALAAQVGGIDLIVGGHSHRVLPNGLRGSAREPLIVQAGWALTRVGQVELVIDARTKKLRRASARLVDLWLDQVGEDPAVAGIVAKLSREAGARYDVIVATAAAALWRSADAESSLGDWMTDCERDWAGADLAVQNGGAPRADLPAGPVSRRALFEVMPFDDRLVKLVMRGQDVKAWLELGVGATRPAQISGASVSYHRQAAAGRRLESVRIAGRELVESSTYTVVTLDFVAQGGDGYGAFAAAQSQDFAPALLRDVLERCARRQGLIKIPPAGRLVPLRD